MVASVGTYDWLLFLHVVSAFALVAALVLFTALVVATRRVDRPSIALLFFRLVRPGSLLVAVGSLLTLVFGVWLAIYLDAYHPWDGWILAAIVLWVIATGAGQRAGVRFGEARALAERLGGSGDDAPSSELRAAIRDRQAVVLHAVTSVSTLVILVLMIWKPGA